MKNYEARHSIYVAIFAVIVSLICAIVGVRDDDSLLRGLAVGMLIMAGINLVMAWRLRKAARARV